MPTPRRRKHTAVESDSEETPKQHLRQTKKVNNAADSEDDKMPARKARILPTNRVKRADREDFAENAKSSRLLRLPAELRERIWKLVLGGKNVHVYTLTNKQFEKGLSKLPDAGLFEGHDEWDEDSEEDEYIGTSDKSDNDDDDYDLSSDGDEREHKKSKKRTQLRIRHSVCTCTPTDAEDVSLITAQSSSIRSKEHDTWRRRHRRYCFAFHKTYRRRQLMDLAILSVCRQIHGEAALLPFQENTFCFRDFGVLEVFLTNLIPSQLHAVQHITMAYAYDRMDETRRSVDSKIKTSFRSLQSLTIILESDLEIDWSSEWHSVELYANVMQFKKLKLGSVTVQARVTETWAIRHGDFTFTQLEAWAGALEEMLSKD